MKTIALSGAANTESPFGVSFQNKYDNKRPLYTKFSINPKTHGITFQMNYDLGKFLLFNYTYVGYLFLIN